ncbi:hypothetical protein ACSQ67_008918 [Phaseolus vulgaris]
MASHYELEVNLASARGLKNVNWRHGANRPYAVVWVDAKNKCSTTVDEDGDTEATWNQTLVIPLPPEPLEDLSPRRRGSRRLRGGHRAAYRLGSAEGSSYSYGTAQEEKKSKFGGMGTGLAVGAVAGVLGGVALVEGADFLEDKIADDVAENVEDDLGYDEDDF